MQLSPSATTTDAPILWPPHAKSWLIGKDPDAGKDWGQEEKWATEDEMVGWHHWLNGYEFEQTLRNSEGQGSLVCCSPWGCKESDMTCQPNLGYFQFAVVLSGHKPTVSGGGAVLWCPETDVQHFCNRLAWTGWNTWPQVYQRTVMEIILRSEDPASWRKVTYYPAEERPDASSKRKFEKKDVLRTSSCCWCNFKERAAVSQKLLQKTLMICDFYHIYRSGRISLYIITWYAFYYCVTLLKKCFPKENSTKIHKENKVVPLHY